MPVPAAVPDTPPLAVLVLAWDEATPAVRALVEATQAPASVVDSILVMVPQADAPDHFSAEEYLPVPPLAPEPLPAPATAPAPELPPTQAAEPSLPVATSVGSAEVIEDGSTSQVLVGKEVAPTMTSATMAPAPLAWTAVRILRLSSLSLSELAQRAGQPLPAPIWTGTLLTPAAPYLGAATPPYSPAPSVAELLPTAGQSAASAMPAVELHPLPQPQRVAGLTGVPAALPAAAVPAPHYTSTEVAQAPDPEADLQPSEADEPAEFELSISNLVADAPASRRPAAQADWQAALAALHQPASLPAPEPALEPALELPAPTPAAHPALRSAAAHYPAPDLNFQIIQYARFAVPVALAEPSFAVVYAPAWPTWLAAQELRQRTGQPLVLHVSTLAAADNESIETATGWIAELQRQALHRADLLLAETPALAQRLRYDLGLPASAVQVVPAANAAAIGQALHETQLSPASSALK